MGSEMKSHISIKELTETGFNVHSTLHNMYNGGGEIKLLQRAEAILG